jgi:hypothetical protein
MRLLTLMLALLAVPAAAEPPAFSNAVADSELAEMRGGFALPGGLDIAMSVATETSVDGALLLRSVFTAGNGATSLQVYSGGAPAAGGSGQARTMNVGGRDVSFDSRSGTISVPTRINAPNITIGGRAAAAATPAGPALDLANGAVRTAAGTVSVEALPVGGRVNLQGQDIDVSHLYGSSIGSVIANNGSDRAIDTVTTVGLDIRGATPLNLGSSLFRVDAIALESVRALTR